MYKHKLNADKRQNYRYGRKYWKGDTYKKHSPYHEDRSCARDYSREYLEVPQTAVFDAQRDYPKTDRVYLPISLIAAWVAVRKRGNCEIKSVTGTKQVV